MSEVALSVTAEPRPTPQPGARPTRAARLGRGAALAVAFLLLAVGTGTDLEGLAAAITQGTGSISSLAGRAPGLGIDATGDGAGCLPELAPAEAWIQLPDGHGGAFYQLAEPDPATEPEHIWWDRPDGSAVVVVEADADTAVRPYASAGAGDDTTLWFTTREPGRGPTDDVVSLYSLDLRSGQQDLIVYGIGGFEVAPLLVSPWAAGLLVSNADSTGSWFELYDGRGDPVAWPANPHPVDDYTHKTVYGTLSHDGRAVASIEAIVDEQWTLVVRSFDTSEVLSIDPLPPLRRVMSALTSSDGVSFAVETETGDFTCVNVPFDAVS